ncbi:MAG: hypothetical protein AAGA21_23800 [Pseudomonadota bacterium]
MSKRRRGRDGTKDVLAPTNDNQATGVQSGEAGLDELWSVSDLIPLVRLLTRQAAREIFSKAANDDRQSLTERPKE